MYSMFQLPLSAPSSSVGQILSVLLPCTAETNAPGDEKCMGSRFFVMMMRPLKRSSGLPPPASAPAPASVSVRRATNPNAILCMPCSRKEEGDCMPRPRRAGQEMRRANELTPEAGSVPRAAPRPEEGFEPLDGLGLE